MKMQKACATWILVLASAAALTACGGGGGGGDSGGGGTKPPPPTGNNIVASWSQDGTVQSITGGTQAVSLSFTSDDGKAVTNLKVTQNLATLPAGWKAGNAAVNCASVSTGNGCVQLLTYAPTAAATGTLSIAYSYTDSAAASRTGTATINYAATAHNNVNLTVLPVGQVSAKIGTSQTVTMLFTTDDGSTATHLSVTSGLTGLPAGWSAASSTFTCASVNGGNGCLLNLTYAPTAAGSGSLTLGFSFTDNASNTQNSSITIHYSAINDNSIVATTSPVGQVTANVGSPFRQVTVSFTTDDGMPATALQISAGLSSLPAGWSGPATFTCASVSTGNGCQLNIDYAPTAVGSGSLPLSFSYTSGGGAARTGSIVIPYAATADNNVVATVSPSGQINALAGSGTQTVLVTFTTDDGNQASNLSISGGLSAFPSGWTGPTTFTCAGFATGNGCQLTLHYAPPVVEAGTLSLSYSYKSNSGATKTGSIGIPYQSTSHNNVVATVNPTGQVTAVVNQGTQLVNITFTTDDGNPATTFSITSGLGALPTDWTVVGGAPTLTCASVPASPACVLPLQFQPTVKSSGTLSFGYSFTDNAGGAQTGTVDVPYASIPTYFYANEQTNTVLRCAASFSDGSLSGCSPVATGFAVPYGLAFSGNFVYVADNGDAAAMPPVAGSVKVCPVNADGTFGACVAAAPAGTFTTPNAMAASNGFLYVADADGGKGIQVCAMNATDGTLSACASTAGSVATPLDVPDGIVVSGAKAYIVDYKGAGQDLSGQFLGNLTTCDVALNGTLVACTQQVIGNTPTGLAVYNGNLYVGTGDTTDSIKLCPIAVDGSVTTPCVGTGASSAFSQAVGFGFVNGFAYVSGYGGASGNIGGIAYCPLNPNDGTFDNCLRSTDKLTKRTNFFGMSSH